MRMVMWMSSEVVGMALPSSTPMTQLAMSRCVARVIDSWMHGCERERQLEKVRRDERS